MASRKEAKLFNRGKLHGRMNLDRKMEETGRSGNPWTT
jgi:hypothetical protein